MLCSRASASFRRFVLPRTDGSMNSIHHRLFQDGFASDADRALFSNWLQCYMKLDQCVDSIGRTMWFSKALPRPQGAVIPPQKASGQSTQRKARLRPVLSDMSDMSMSEYSFDNGPGADSSFASSPQTPVLSRASSTQSETPTLGQMWKCPY
eukprot:m.788411 g.788411  ORF g.788411 m.788411 type:complete len:152 (+) comp59192_c1_seq23:1081-1536(+)